MQGKIDSMQKQLEMDLAKVRERREMLTAQLEQTKQHEQRVIGAIQALKQLMAEPKQEPKK